MMATYARCASTRKTQAKSTKYQDPLRPSPAPSHFTARRYRLTAPMNTCPPEIHSYIAQLACTDDGSTVHALLRVSRHFNAIARPYLFRSLSLCGPERIARISALLERTPTHLRHIHHLFISDRDLPHDEQRSFQRQRALSYPSSPPPKVTALLKVLSFAAPTLESLAFCSQPGVGSTSLIAQLFRMHFPQLRELSVHGFYPFPSTRGGMPKLERLHLAGNRNPHGLLQLGGLSTACPSLSHLRVSGVLGAVAFSEEIREALSERSSLPDRFPASLPATTHEVIVQPGTESTCETGRFAGLSKMMMHNFRELHLTQVRRGHDQDRHVRFSLVEPEKAMGTSTSTSMRRHWAERIEGREGCWVTP